MTLEASSNKPMVSIVNQPGGPLDENLNAWTESLDARNISYRLVGNRLRVEPWSLLTNEDRAFIKQHRAAIKEHLRLGPRFSGPRATPPDATPAAAKPIDEKPGPRPEIARIVYGNTPEETARRNAEATAVMMRQIPFGHPEY